PRNFNMRRVLRSLVITLAAAVFAGMACLYFAKASEKPEKQPAERVAPKNEVAVPVAYRTFATRPDLHYAADLRFKLPVGQERVIYVVPQNKASDLFVKGLFFYTPALFLVENEKPIDGFPAVVQNAEMQSDKSTFVGFKAIVHSDPLSQYARDAILQQP